MAEFPTYACSAICLLNLLAIRCLHLWCQPMGPLCLWQCFYNYRFVSSVFIYLYNAHCAQRTKSIFYNGTFVSYVKVARLRDRIREESSNYVLHNHHGLFMHQLLHLLSSKLAMNDQIVGHTEYKIHLRSDLRVYCPTSEVYCPTWVFGSSNFSPT